MKQRLLVFILMPLISTPAWADGTQRNPCDSELITSS